ncbi:MFS transporter [Allokutzneria sp. A3M-2-11 16]|uniref:CynX/NimT family MFS transporter n=1 Tax=Allokutzneria sp. A3M-2-11 16 TaxID=2962043 RepID=UPI0020B8521B|nr:MFS transporter [Allokutzneria sp. A3M-2-11 16]MCP3797907.1 MFS transporter [Allokutzneria sp. A3M-2-11 16]
MTLSPQLDQPARTRSAPAASVAGGLALVVGVMLAAANLRPAVTSLAAVLSEVRDTLGVSAAWTSAVTAIPTLCFGLVGMLAPWFSRRYGARAVISGALVLITAGLALRVVDGPLVLVAGTFLACAAIAVCNVLIPVVVKDSFPAGKVGAVTGAYSAALSAGGAVAAAFTAPLEELVGGWRGAVGMWALLGVLALICWRLAGRGPAPSEAVVADSAPRRSLLRSPLAWAVTVFFGFQSLVAYTVMGWLPEILRDTAGVSATTAGQLLAIVMVLGVPVSMIVPPLAARARSQSAWAMSMALSGFVGFAGLLFAPATATGLWILLIGIGMGVFPLALTLITLRARTGQETARLSAMAQSLGYLIAAVGPFAVGILHGLTGGWTVPLTLVLVVLAAQIALGHVAGRPRYV